MISHNCQESLSSTDVSGKEVNSWVSYSCPCSARYDESCHLGCFEFSANKYSGSSTLSLLPHPGSWRRTVAHQHGLSRTKALFYHFNISFSKQTTEMYSGLKETLNTILSCTACSTDESFQQRIGIHQWTSRRPAKIKVRKSWAIVSLWGEKKNPPATCGNKHKDSEEFVLKNKVVKRSRRLAPDNRGSNRSSQKTCCARAI